MYACVCGRKTKRIVTQFSLVLMPKKYLIQIGDSRYNFVFRGISKIIDAAYE